MDPKKRFTALLTVGVLLLLTPIVLKFVVLPPDSPGLPSTAEYFPVQEPKTGKWGFIDKTGQPVTPMVFDWAGDYRAGLGLVETDGAMGYINDQYAATGEYAITPRFTVNDKADQPAFGFFDGLALARDDSGKWGYLNTEGQWAIDPRFIESEDYPGTPAGDFSDGLAWFQVVQMSERYLLDDKQELQRDADGKPMMERYPRRLIGYIDRKGEVVIEPRYEMAADFGEGLAAVRIKSHEAWGFIDRAGKRVLTPEYDRVGRFSEGLCAVSVNGRWGYIDPEGAWVIEPAFTEAGDFSEGLAAVREASLWGYIDQAGAYIIRPAYDNFEDYAHPGDARPFENGLARVTLNGKRIYIDSTGEKVWPKD